MPIGGNCVTRGLGMMLGLLEVLEELQLTKREVT